MEGPSKVIMRTAYINYETLHLCYTAGFKPLAIMAGIITTTSILLTATKLFRIINDTKTSKGKNPRAWYNGFWQENISNWLFCKASNDLRTASSVLFVNVKDSIDFLKKESSIMSRAIPNQRLHSVFKVSNPFTNPDNEYRKAFIKVITNHIKFRPDDWEALVQTVQDSILRNAPPRQRSIVSLAGFVQKITLEAVLTSVMDIDVASLPEHGPAEISKIINDLWIQSKVDGTSDLNEKNYRRLTEYLVGASTRTSVIMKNISEMAEKHFPSIFSGNMSTTEENSYHCPEKEDFESPLNVILPAYETMWRVVLYALLEVQVRPLLLHPDNEYHEIPVNASAMEFLENPAFSTLKEIPSLHNLVKEVLRLYPPTRRIHRSVWDEATHSFKSVSVDIEAIHRTSSVWGDNAEQFCPGRFESLTSEQKEAFIPFSTGRMKCVAMNEFAPTFSASLIACFFKHIRIVKIVNPLDSLNLDVNKPFQNSRTAFDSLVVEIHTETN